MWDTLDLCINVVDTESLDQLVPHLARLVRSGVGLNTRWESTVNFIIIWQLKATGMFNLIIFSALFSLLRY